MSNLHKLNLSYLERSLASALAVFLVAGALVFFPAGPAAAQKNSQFKHLSGKEKKFLMSLAKEPLNALIKSTVPLERKAPASMTRLNQSQRLVVTVFVDGQLVARAWELRQPGPLQAAAVSLGARALVDPDVGRALTSDEWSRATISVAIIYNFADLTDDRQAQAGQALVVLNDFDFAVGLPSDLPAGYTTAQLLTAACQLSGLRPNAWLGQRVSLFAGDVEEIFE
ncbi:MAG: hypothetical protein LBT47_13895 [Deltaproteobacteria bacterium]|nr:hypothetical protein [Deltaproteobacteria bacterium]